MKNNMLALSLLMGAAFSSPFDSLVSTDFRTVKTTSRPGAKQRREKRKKAKAAKKRSRNP